MATDLHTSERQIQLYKWGVSMEPGAQLCDYILPMEAVKDLDYVYVAFSTLRIIAWSYAYLCWGYQLQCHEQ